jgi:hypothetical protein
MGAFSLASGLHFYSILYHPLLRHCEKKKEEKKKNDGYGILGFRKGANSKYVFKEYKVRSTTWEVEFGRITFHASLGKKRDLQNNQGKKV